MRELHVIAVSDDGRHVLLAPTKSGAGTYRVRLDARLIAAVRGELPGTEPTVDLSPKEIQARLRAGESAEQIARSAGVPVTRVERFAGPVAGEMARMIDAARDAYLVRGRRGPSAVRLGAAVDPTVGKDATWTTHREEDGRWRVEVAWQARGRARHAAWFYDPATKALTAEDPASAALGHVDTSPRTTTSKPAAARTAPAPKAAAKKPAPKKPAAKTPAKPAAKPAPKAAPKAVAKKPPARTSGRPRLQVVPSPAPAAKRSAPQAAAQRDASRGRASVPAWADVLLGTTPGADR